MNGKIKQRSCFFYNFLIIDLCIEDTDFPIPTALRQHAHVHPRSGKVEHSNSLYTIPADTWYICAVVWISTCWSIEELLSRADYSRLIPVNAARRAWWAVSSTGIMGKKEGQGPHISAIHIPPPLHFLTSTDVDRHTEFVRNNSAQNRLLFLFCSVQKTARSVRSDVE